MPPCRGVAHAPPRSLAGMTASEHILVEGLSKVFPHRGRPLEALRGIDLRVGRGEFVSVIGPSGCGKSTLLRHRRWPAVAYARPRAGRWPPAARGAGTKDIGVVFQDPSLLPWRTVIDNVRLPLRGEPRRPPARFVEPQRAPGAGRPGRLRRLLPAPALGRHAAAGGDRPGARLRARRSC